MMKMKKFSVLISVCISVLLVWVAYCFSSFAYIEGVNPESDIIKAEIQNYDTIKNTFEGTFLDADGNVLCYALKKGSGGIIDHECYQRLIGFSTGLMYGQSGLRSIYHEELWTPDKKTSKGATFTLTTNSEIQSIAYEEISSYSEGESCAVVLENKTGKVIALASANSKYNLDYNNITPESYAKAAEVDGYFVDSWNTMAAPGSVMKAATALSIAEKGLNEEIYHDTGTELIDGYAFKNYGTQSYGDVSLNKGVQHSINTYFAHMGLKVGSFALRDAYERFMIGKTLKLDFATVKSAHNLDNDVSKTNIAATAFGQGKLMLTPINIALIAQSIANDGIMLKPYVVDSVVTDSKDTLVKGKTEKLSKIGDKDVVKIIKEALYLTADSYEIDAKYNIGAKSGTAQMGNGLNRASFMAFNDDYTVVIVVNNTSRMGGSLKSSVLRIFDALSLL